MNLAALGNGLLVAVLLGALAAPAAPLLKIRPTKETPKKNVVLLVAPFSVDEEAEQPAGFGAAEAITDLFAQQNVGSWISSKQLDAALRRKDLQLYDAADLEVILPLARTLGATDLIVGQILNGEKTLTVRAQRYGVVSKEVLRETSVEGPADQLPQLAAQVAQKLADVSPKMPLLTTNAKALAGAADCWRALVRYPLQPRAGMPPPLDDAAALEVSCAAAVQLDPSFAWPHAGLAVLKVLKGDAAGARAEIAAAKQKGRFDAWLALADSFAARRAGDAKSSRAVLEGALKERPGFLTAASYLAEDRMDAGDYKGALSAWNQFLDRAPANPYALGQKAKALGYLHKDRSALALTRQALDIDPGDPELLIELASRQIDAKQNAEAEATLQKAMDARPPRPLAWLRLGYLYILENKPREAHDTLIEGVTYAYREDESRTRGGLFADLALVEGMQAHGEKAIQYLQQAKDEGYASLPCDAPQLKSLQGKPEFVAVCKH